MRASRIIGLKEVMEKLQISYKEAMRICRMKGCPTLQRSKGQTFRIVESAFDEWVAGGCKE